MEVSAVLQVRMFLCALLLGVAFGVLDHLFRLTAAFLQMDTRRCTGNLWLDGWSHTGLFFFDLTFFAIAAVVSCAFFYLLGDGRPRAFAIFGMLFSFWIYRVSVGRWFLKAAKRCGRWLFYAVFSGVRFCARPAALAAKRCKNAAKPIVSAAKAKYNKRKNVQKQADRRAAVLLRNGVRKGEQVETERKIDLTRL